MNWKLSKSVVEFLGADAIAEIKKSWKQRQREAYRKKFHLGIDTVVRPIYLEQSERWVYLTYSS